MAPRSHMVTVALLALGMLAIVGNVSAASGSATASASPTPTPTPTSSGMNAHPECAPPCTSGMPRWPATGWFACPCPRGQRTPFRAPTAPPSGQEARRRLWTLIHAQRESERTGEAHRSDVDTTVATSCNSNQCKHCQRRDQSRVAVIHRVRTTIRGLSGGRHGEKGPL
jgi:hypothetical protein